MTDTENKNTEALQRLMDKMLLALEDSHHVNVHNFFNSLTRTGCLHEGIRFDGRAALEYWWHLARLGVIAVHGAGVNGSFPSEFRSLILTDRGRALLERGESSPHYPLKYLEAVRKRVSEADDIAMTYLNEAVGAWSAGLYRSSAVMLGCACERLVLILAEAIAAKSGLPGSPEISKALSGRVFISPLFERIRNCLAKLKASKTLPGGMGDALNRTLSAIFDHVRVLRNETGHPTGGDVSSEEAEAGLLLFPGFYVLVDELCVKLASLP